MAIIEAILIDPRGSLEIDKQEASLEWLVFSDTQKDYARQIALQCINAGICSMPGTPYLFENDRNDTCYAGKIDASDREIIRGDGDFHLVPTVNGFDIRKIYNGNPLIMWRVKQSFSTDYEKKCDAAPSYDDKVTIRMSCEWEEVPFINDVRTGRPAVNSVGEPFNPPATIRRKIPVYSIARREIANPLAKAISYSNTVNLLPFYGAMPGTILMDSIITEFDGQAWRVTYNMKEKLEGWHTFILDTGYNRRLPNGLLAPIVDDCHVPVCEPVKLNGQGVPLRDQSLPGFNLGPFHKYESRPFALLRLPNPFEIDTITDTT